MTNNDLAQPFALKLHNRLRKLRNRLHWLILVILKKRQLSLTVILLHIYNSTSFQNHQLNYAP